MPTCTSVVVSFECLYVIFQIACKFSFMDSGIVFIYKYFIGVSDNKALELN